MGDWLTELTGTVPALQHARQAEDILQLLARSAGRAFGAAALVLEPELERGPGLLWVDEEASDAREPGPAVAALGAAALHEGRMVLAHPESGDGDATSMAAALRELDAAAIAFMPLLARSRRLGVLVLVFDEEPDPRQLEQLPVLTLPFALALDARAGGAASAGDRFLASIVASSADAIFSKDLDGIITSWNRGAERMYGYSPAEIIGHPVTLLVPPEVESDVPDIMARLRRGERIEHYETTRMTRDGRRLTVALSISPIRDDRDRLLGAATIARDMTLRRRMEEQARIAADLGRALVTGLDEGQALRDLGRCLVRGFADYVVTYSLGADGTIRRVGTAHADPRKQHLVDRLLAAAPPHVFDTWGAGAVLRTGEPVLVDSITDEMLEVYAGSDEHLETLRALEPISSMILPLRARGRTVGAFASMTTSLSGRRYTHDDFEFAKDMADRAALAIDNARLLDESRRELRRREKVEAALRIRLEQLHVLYQMTEAVGRAGALQEIYDEAFRAMRRYLGNDRASILLWDPDGVLRFKAWQGLSDGYRRAVEGHSPWDPDTENPPPVVIPDVAASTELEETLKATILDEGIRALAFFPLAFGRRLLGKFMLYFDRPRALAADEVDLCQAIGGTVAFAITRMIDEQNVRVARDMAERASQAKSQFLGVMSHELRTPLNAVIGYADLLLMEIRGSLTKGQREQVERMRASARHQLGLIEELLTYTRLEAGREQARLMPTDVRRIIADVAEFVRPEAEMKGIDLEVDLPEAPLEIITDPAKLRQIILNFAANATKFTQEGRVTLRAWRNGEHVVGEVRDTGPGIPEEKLSHIFEPFAQVDEGPTRHSGGTGLGLAIARRFSRMLGAEIHVDSRVGEGSTFRLCLPIRGIVGSRAQDAGTATLP